MDLQIFLKANVERIGIETCAAKAGYKVVSKGVHHIQSLLDEPFCGELGSQSVQDWNHSDSTLIRTLCELFECPEELIEKNRYAAQCVLKDRETAVYRHIKVVVEKNNLRSWAQAVGYEYFTTIKNLYALSQYDLQHQLENVSRIIKDHYAHNQDKTPFGAILSYRYHYDKDKEPVEFDVEGNVISASDE